jgi:hypothetical protein
MSESIANEVDDDINDSLELQLERHKEILIEQIENGELEIVQFHQNKIINLPITYMDHRILNPNLYHRLAGITDLNHFAQLIEAPSNWEEYYNKISVFVHEEYRTFKNIDVDTNEESIELQLNLLVAAIWTQLRRFFPLASLIAQKNPHSRIIAGFLAHEDLHARLNYYYSSSGIRYVNNHFGVSFLSAEVKHNLRIDDLYYRGNTGIRAFTALYSNFAPTLLFSQYHFKILVENKERTQIFTYP